MTPYQRDVVGMAGLLLVAGSIGATFGIIWAALVLGLALLIVALVYPDRRR